MATIKIERIINAPVEKVWSAWVDEEIIKKWWGPKDFTAPHITNDFRIGGKTLYSMFGSAGPGMPPMEFWSTGTYLEIEPMKKIVATDNFSDEKGNIISPNDVGMPGKWDEQMIVTVTFEDFGDNKTKLIIEHIGHPDEMTQNATIGWNQSIDKLENAVNSK